MEEHCLLAYSSWFIQPAFLHNHDHLLTVGWASRMYHQSRKMPTGLSTGSIWREIFSIEVPSPQMTPVCAKLSEKNSNHQHHEAMEIGTPSAKQGPFLALPHTGSQSKSARRFIQSSLQLWDSNGIPLDEQQRATEAYRQSNPVLFRHGKAFGGQLSWSPLPPPPPSPLLFLPSFTLLSRHKTQTKNSSGERGFGGNLVFSLQVIVCLWGKPRQELKQRSWGRGSLVCLWLTWSSFLDSSVLPAQG